MAKKIGRPTDYTTAIADKILDLMGDGELLIDICAAKGMPPARTVRGWAHRDEDGSFKQAFACAREEQAHAWFERAIRESSSATNKDEAAAARVRADGLFRAAARLHPASYGDHQKIEHSGQVAATIQIVQFGSAGKDADTG